jgi:hypothetical protein
LLGICAVVVCAGALILAYRDKGVVRQISAAEQFSRGINVLLIFAAIIAVISATLILQLHSHMHCMIQNWISVVSLNYHNGCGVASTAEFLQSRRLGRAMLGLLTAVVFLIAGIWIRWKTRAALASTR